jgi:hypothetical protein
VRASRLTLRTKLWRLSTQFGYRSYERDRWFESGSLQQRVRELSVPPKKLVRRDGREWVVVTQYQRFESISLQPRLSHSAQPAERKTQNQSNQSMALDMPPTIGRNFVANKSSAGSAIPVATQ